MDLMWFLRHSKDKSTWLMLDENLMPRLNTFWRKQACMLNLFFDFTFLSMITFLYLAAQPHFDKSKDKG